MSVTIIKGQLNACIRFTSPPLINGASALGSCRVMQPDQPIFCILDIVIESHIQVLQNNRVMKPKLVCCGGFPFYIWITPSGWDKRPVVELPSWLPKI